MRIYCIGDSLGLPREGVTYEDTWYYKLKQSYPEHDFVEHFERGLLISTALSNYDNYFVFYPSDVVIIQTGICDCSPRYINENKFSVTIVKKLFRKLGLIDFFWKLVKIGGRNPKCVDTPIDKFSADYDKLISKFINSGVRHIFLIKIGHATESVVKKNKYINENVDKYNEIIENIKEKYRNKIDVIDPLDKIDESLFVDGYHCNAKGMDLVFNYLKKELEKTIHHV